MTRYFSIIFCLLYTSLCGAQKPADDYDVFTSEPSEELLAKGRQYFEQRDAGKSLVCFSIVCERYNNDATPEETRQAIRAMNNCGCVFKFLYYDYLQAYKYFSRAYELCEEKGQEDLLPLILVNLGDLLNDYGTIYGSQDISKQATEFFDQSFSKAIESKNWELLTTSFFNLSNQNYDLELSKYKQIFSKEIPDSTPDIKYVRLQYQGIEKIQQGKYAEARECFDRQLHVVSTRWQPERDTLTTIMSIAKTYELENDYKNYSTQLQKALKLSNAYDLNDYNANIYKQLSICFQKLGDTILQREYHLAYLEKMEEMHANRLSNVGELRYLNELEKKEAKAKEMALRQEMQQLVIVAIIIVLIVVIFSALILWRQNRTLQSRNQSLFEKYSQVLRVEAEEHKLRKIKDVTAQDAKYSHSSLNDEQRETLIFRIQEIFDNPDFICQQDFTLNQLAKLVDSNTTYVSQVINEKYGVTFSNLLGSFRVKEACRRINESSQYDNLTIEGIATNIGFKSRTAFINAFKREVGLTPSEYLRIAANSKE